MEKLEVHNIYIRYLALSPFHFCFHWNLPSQCIPAVSFLPKKAVEFLSLIGPCYITSTDTSKEAVRKGCKKGCRNTHTHMQKQNDRSWAAEWEVISSSKIQKESHQQETL